MLIKTQIFNQLTSNQFITERPYQDRLLTAEAKDLMNYFILCHLPRRLLPQGYLRAIIVLDDKSAAMNIRTIAKHILNHDFIHIQIEPVVWINKAYIITPTLGQCEIPCMRYTMILRVTKKATHPSRLSNFHNSILTLIVSKVNRSRVPSHRKSNLSLYPLQSIFPE